MIDMTYWCESCARKNNCYTIRNRPKCFTPITSNDRTADCKTEPQISMIIEAYSKGFKDGAEAVKEVVFTERQKERASDGSGSICTD